MSVVDGLGTPLTSIISKRLKKRKLIDALRNTRLNKRTKRANSIVEGGGFFLSFQVLAVFE